MKKGYFEPTEMTQFVNTQLNFEFIFLFTDVKMSVLGRKFSETSSKDVFLAYFTLDYIDIMGIKRKLSLFEDFCDLGDFNPKKQDPLHQLSADENYSIQRKQQLIRSIPFDIDDDVIITPNFNTRKGNSLIVIPANVWLNLLQLTLLPAKVVTDIEQTPIKFILSYQSEIVEDNATQEECIIN